MIQLQDTDLRLAPMTAADVDEVWALECSVFPYPWSRGNFADAVASGYDCWTVRDADGELAGYYLLMYALDEAHLLDVAVAGKRQRQGLGRRLLYQIGARALGQGMESILLEVRPSNERALEVYRRHGYVQIGRRKGYYPAGPAGREDAIVMRLDL
ncbi:ribosomal protein S18-alanine N-acetyltransferase [Massilia oculi]|jgi:ribosomal-protein-alanine N-acetyltransferase|uniref:ribosomal protein S18-alanine N-acetyltransferase n=1 Tax=Massilia oculi TaxID=945844 RepID=UPI001AAFE493|nr:ribosomal protein S18-alanine N-acetyltransferase [Massilia oculi]